MQILSDKERKKFKRKMNSSRQNDSIKDDKFTPKLIKVFMRMVTMPQNIDDMLESAINC